MNRILSGMLLIFFTLHSYSLYCQNYKTGLLIDNINYDKVPQVGYGMSFSKSSTKNSISLRKYCPTPGNQGNIASCTGWAIANAYTISYCAENDITDPITIKQEQFSPMFIYNLLLKKNNKDSFTSLYEGMLLLKKMGICKSELFCPNKCDSMPSIEIRKEANAYKIPEYASLFPSDDNSENKILSTIKCLTGNTPVIIGMTVTKSFFNKNGKFWQPEDKEDSISSHAMVVIGYDNLERKFEIMNSWGTAWKDKGFFKISYEDFARMIRQAYIIKMPNEHISVLTKGAFHIEILDYVDSISFEPVFTELHPQYNTGIYEIEVKKRDNFKLKVDKTTKNTYVYIFSIKPNGSIELIYPENGMRNSGISKNAFIPCILSEDVIVNVPKDPNESIQSDLKGEDYLCVLYCPKNVENITATLSKINKSSKKNIRQKLKEIFGENLAKETLITYQYSCMEFTARNCKTNIVPILLKATVK